MRTGKGAGQPPSTDDKVQDHRTAPEASHIRDAIEAAFRAGRPWNSVDGLYLIARQLGRIADALEASSDIERDYHVAGRAA